MVLTIDPAKRLAQSLGLDALASGGERIDDAVIDAAGLHLKGSLSAGVLDQKSAWDEFITRHSPNEATRNAILNNEFYQQLSQSFAGSAEYMAVEELCRIDESGEYDLIVLDTPPTRHALDFLEAPRRLEDFLDRSIVGWFVKPYASAGWAAWKTASRTVRFLFEKIEDATGLQALGQISEFFIAMERLFDGITERSRNVRGLLAGEQTAFVLVAGPDEQVLGESESLGERMNELGMQLKGVVMNRLHPLPSCAEEPLTDEERGGFARLARAHGADDEVIAWMLASYEDARVIARAETLRREAFWAGLGSAVATATVPELDRDVHDLAGLAEVAAIVCGEVGAER
jgi:anion-transporting  ArsA/GET3 family ATPase